MTTASNQVADATEDIVEKMDTVCQQLSSINGEVTKISQVHVHVHGRDQGHTGSTSLRDGTIESVQSMKGSVETLNESVDALNNRIGKIEEGQAANHEKLLNLDRSNQSMKASMGEMKDAINESVDAQNQRAEKIEEGQAANHEKLHNLHQSVQSMKASMGEIKDMINALNNQLTLQTKKQQQHQQQPVIGQTLSRERHENLITCEDAWSSFIYYQNHYKGTTMSAGKDLMKQILQLFAAGAGYNIPKEYNLSCSSSDARTGEESFEYTLLFHLKILLGHAPRVEVEDDDSYSLYYA